MGTEYKNYQITDFVRDLKAMYRAIGRRIPPDVVKSIEERHKIKVYPHGELYD